MAPKDVRLLAGLYALIGSYADAERIAQWGLDTENPEGKEREKLQKAVGVMQIKEGKTIATPGAGSALLGALLQGVGQGLAQGLGDQSAEPPPAPPSAEDQQAQAQSDAQDAFAKAQKQIHNTLNDEWGFRTPQRKKLGGRPISMSALYKMFGNPFYAGVLPWRGEWHTGKHEPMITLDELDRVGAILGRPNASKPETQQFAFTGLIRCSCGLSITAERKTKPSGRQYVYYHCTRSREPNLCQEPAVREEVIEDGIIQFLRDIRFPESYERFFAAKLHASGTELDQQHKARVASAEQALRDSQNQQRALVDLKIRGLIEDADFVQRRQDFKKNEIKLQESLVQLAAKPSSALELVNAAILFRKCAADWFAAGNLEEKRLVLQTVSSNSVLSGKKLSIQARFPFQQVPKAVDCLWWYAIVNALRTRVRTH